MKIKISLIFLAVVFVIPYRFALAQQVPAAQQASGQESLRQLQENDKKLREKIQQNPKAAVETVNEVKTEQANEAPDAEKILLKTIYVAGNTVLSQ